jgi:hypothetical protein
MEPSNEEQTNETESSGRDSQGFGGPEPSSNFSESPKSEGSGALQGVRAAAERGKDNLLDQAQGVAQALHQASEGLEPEHEELARYTRGIADKVEQVSGSLKGRDLATIAQDITRFAQRQPALFLGGAFTVGLIAARFLKSSRPAADAGNGGR